MARVSLEVTRRSERDRELLEEDVDSLKISLQCVTLRS